MNVLRYAYGKNVCYFVDIYMHFRVDWIELQGMKYHLGDFIWCGYQDDLPRFGKLSEILLTDSKTFFCLYLYSTKGIDRHYNRFIIHPDSTQSKLIKLLICDDKPNNRLISFQAHSLRSSSVTLHIVSKYFI